MQSGEINDIHAQGAAAPSTCRAHGINAVVHVEVTDHTIARLVAEGYLADDASREAISAALSKMLGTWAGVCS